MHLGVIEFAPSHAILLRLGTRLFSLPLRDFNLHRANALEIIFVFAQFFPHELRPKCAISSEKYAFLGRRESRGRN